MVAMILTTNILVLRMLYILHSVTVVFLPVILLIVLIPFSLLL